MQRRSTRPPDVRLRRTRFNAVAVRVALRVALRVPLGALGLVASAAVLAGCASDTADVAPGAAEVAAPISARALATSLGLRAPRATAAGPVYIESGHEGRIALFPGSNIATVRGVRYSLSERLAKDAIELRIPAFDAEVLRRMWQQGIHVGPTQSTVSALGTGAAPGSDRPGFGKPGSVARPLSIDDLPPAPAHVVRRPASAAPRAPGAQLSRRERAAWAVPLRRPWQYIVVHHSATPGGNATAFNKAHLARGWDGLGYDFVIGNGNGSPDGKVEVGFRWTKQREGAHAGNDLMNQRGIGICLVGNFNKTRPTAAQMASLRRLSDFLSAYCEIPPQNLRLHRDFRQTACPGRYFPRTFALRPLPVFRGASAAGAVHRPAGR